MTSVLISIKPKWCELIANGKKTIEVRKTRPKIETPFKCYIYCTNKSPYLVWGDVFVGDWITEYTLTSGYSREEAERIWGVLNGKVIGEFMCDSIECFTTDYRMDKEQTERISEQSCLSFSELADYEYNSHCLYGWHISDLKIYDKPKELTEFNHTNEYIVNLRKSLPHWEYGIDDECVKPIRNPPQSWCYVEEVRE